MGSAKKCAIGYIGPWHVIPPFSVLLRLHSATAALTQHNISSRAMYLKFSRRLCYKYSHVFIPFKNIAQVTQFKSKKLSLLLAQHRSHVTSRYHRNVIRVSA
ncbi:unnamed protein product [Scytosiphon promiscuus]